MFVVGGDGLGCGKHDRLVGFLLVLGMIQKTTCTLKPSLSVTCCLLLSPLKSL